MDIGEVSRRAGLAPSALRFYEERGLIASSGRRGLRRQYDPAVLDRLALISLARAAGFTLAEIAVLFTPGGRPRIDRQKLRQKAEEIDRSIRRLTAMRNGLLHAAGCPARDHLECPRFQRLLRRHGALSSER